LLTFLADLPAYGGHLAIDLPHRQLAGFFALGFLPDGQRGRRRGRYLSGILQNALPTFDGVLILRIAPTAPMRRERPRTQLASSSTMPSSSGSPA
jgi:hypothetical protein